MMQPPSHAHSIPLGEVMRRLDLTARAIRYYEELGLVQAGRDQLNRRRYDEDALARLGAIAEFRRAGLSLDDIAAILSRQDAGRDSESVLKKNFSTSSAWSYVIGTTPPPCSRAGPAPGRAGHTGRGW